MRLNVADRAWWALPLILMLAGCAGDARFGHYRNKMPGYESHFRQGLAAMGAGDVETARRRLAQAARGGHPRAELAYAKSLLREPGRNLKQAQELLESASRKSSDAQALAQFELGRLLVVEDGQGPAMARARELLERALASGVTQARLPLAQILAREPVPDHARIEELLAEAARDGDETALLRLVAARLERGAEAGEIAGIGRRALAILEHRATRGDLGAMRQLARIQASGSMGSADQAQAKAWRGRLVEHGDAEAALELARQAGSRGERGLQAQWLAKAAETGGAETSARIARLYLRGNGVEPDGALGRGYAEAAIKGGSTTGMVVLADALLRGDVLVRDVAAAVELLEEAARRGDQAALTTLGRLHLDGGLVARDPERALSYLRQAAEAGGIQAMGILGVTLLTARARAEDRIAGIRWLEQAAAAGHQPSLTELGRRKLTGRGVPIDPAAGLALLERAASLGHRGAIKLLADAYAGSGAVPADPERAMYWHRRLNEAERESDV